MVEQSEVGIWYPLSCPQSSLVTLGLYLRWRLYEGAVTSIQTWLTDVELKYVILTLSRHYDLRGIHDILGILWLYELKRLIEETVTVTNKHIQMRETEIKS